MDMQRTQKFLGGLDSKVTSNHDCTAGSVIIDLFSHGGTLLKFTLTIWPTLGTKERSRKVKAADIILPTSLTE